MASEADTESLPVKFVPVWVEDAIQLYDIYIGDTWLGSRRTLPQCREAVANALM